MLVIHSKQHIDKAMSCQRNNDGEHISEEVLCSLDEEVKTYLLFVHFTPRF
jgi:hypothetical protein